MPSFLRQSGAGLLIAIVFSGAAYIAQYLGSHYLLLWMFPGVALAAYLAGRLGAISAALALSVAAIPLEMIHGAPEHRPPLPQLALADLLFLLFSVAIGEISERWKRLVAQNARQLEQERQRYAELVHSVAGIVWEARIDNFCFTFVSEQARTLTGYNPEEWREQDFWIDHLHPEERSSVAQSCRLAANRGEAHTMQYRFRRKDGSYLLLRDFVQIVREDAKPVMLRGLMVDISAIEERRKLEDFFSGAMRSSVDEIYVLEAMTDTSGKVSDFRIFSLNERACIEAGMQREQMLGRGMGELFPAQRSAGILEQYIAAYESQTALDHECEIVAPNGAVAVYRQQLLPTDGGLILFQREISGRRMLTDAMERLNERYEAALAASQLGVWEFTDSPNGLRWEDGMYSIYGIERDGPAPPLEVWQSMVHPEDLEATDRAFLDALERGAEIETSFRIVRQSDKSMRWIRARGKAIASRNGRARRLIGTNEDITDRKLQEARLHRAERMQSLGALASGIAHDFNNILAIIAANCELCERLARDKEEARIRLAHIGEAIERGRAIVQQLIVVSGKQSAADEQIELGERVKIVTQMFREVLPRNIRVELELYDELPPILAPASRIDQMLMNLCVNARDAMTPMGGVLRLAVRRASGEELAALAGAEAAVILEVSDTGSGMDAATQSQIFEPFYSTKEPGSGAGLGLAIVAGVVEQLQGAIQVSSAPGKGSRFEVTLPAQARASAAIGDTRERAGSGENRPGADHAGQMPPPRSVLLVEDEQGFRETLATLLRLEGYEVLEAANAESARAILQEADAPPDAAICDLNMPGEAAIDLVDYLSVQMNPDQIIISSGYISPETQARLQRAGVRRLLTKPYGVAELLRALGRGVRP
ncbi:MAG: PAS domain-containing protein [Leptospirales bacterium]|nr:PAS domain-containing protein [Leptospirales bacterium]